MTQRKGFDGDGFYNGPPPDEDWEMTDDGELKNAFPRSPQSDDVGTHFDVEEVIRRAIDGTS